MAAVLSITTQAMPARASYEARPLFQFDDTEIVESSGLAPSTTSDRVFFTHNDSGDVARFFAVDDRGCTLTRFSVTGASATDWEDMARGFEDGHGVLWFADIGDNAFNRPFVTLYRVDEPTGMVATDAGPCPPPAAADVAATRYDIAYPDGSHDAEAIFVHPATGQVFVVTKADRPTDATAVYAAPVALHSDGLNVMTRAVTLSLPLNVRIPDPAVDAVPFGILPGAQLVTGADMADDASRVVVRTYANAYEWTLSDGDVVTALAGAPEEIPLPGEPQGEAIAYTSDVTGLMITSEDTVRTRPPVYLLERRG